MHSYLYFYNVDKFDQLGWLSMVEMKKLEVRY